MLTPTFCSYTWSPISVITSVICRYNPMSSNSVNTPFPLFWSHIWYYGQGASFYVTPLWEMDTEPSKPPLLFWWVQHRWRFPTQCAWYCTSASLISPSSLSCISAAVLIFLQSHNQTSLLLLLLNFFNYLSCLCYFLTECVKFNFLLVPPGKILMTLLQFRLRLRFCSAGWHAVNVATTDPASDTTGHSQFLCWSLLWNWCRWSRCLYFIIAVPPGVGHCRHIIIPPSSTFLPYIHISLVFPLLLPAPRSIPPPVPLHSAAPILPEDHAVMPPSLCVVRTLVISTWQH